MYKRSFTKLVVALLIASSGTACGIKRQEQVEGIKYNSSSPVPVIEGKIREIKNPERISIPAPNEAIATLKEFIAYTSRREPDLFHDEAAQNRFLTNYLRRGVINHWKVYQEHIKQHETCGFPYNGTFVGAWEYPSDYKIIGDRRYDKRVVIDVSYEWNDSDANYSGTTKLVSYSFLLEEGKWKLDDMYTYNGEFVTAYSLSETLWREEYE